MTALRASQQWARVSRRRQRDVPSGASLARAWRLELLATGLLLSGCASFNPFGGGGTAAPPPPVQSQAEPTSPAGSLPPAVPGEPGGPGPGPVVGLLLPLSGSNGGLGDTMLRAAKLALAAPGAPRIDAHDTAGAGGAGEAARLAVQNGDPIILGPLTSSETAAVAPVAEAAHVPVLAFTSDIAQARPGVWVMGITPEQQVRRLVFAAKAEGRSRMAALLPSNALGDALAAGLTQACLDAGLPPPTIMTHAGSRDSIVTSMKQLSDYDTRKAVVDQQIKAATPAPGPAAPAGSGAGLAAAAAGGSGAPAVEAAPPPLPAPPFDALLLGDTGLQLQETIEALQVSGVDGTQVRIMGPGLWDAFAGKLRALAGAWYAAPDPTARRGFAAQYEAAYKAAAKPLDDFAYDAAALARSLAAGGYSVDALTNAQGFAGVDGIFTLKPDGHVHRSLAIFQIQPGGGSVIVQPAPLSSVDTGI